MTVLHAVLRSLRSNLVGWVALFVALGGTGYAAVGQIGGNQIKNHAIQPVKLDTHLIGGVVRVWARVGADGRLLSGSPGASSAYNGLPGVYGVVWSRPRAKFQRCGAIASVTLAGGVDGVADAGPAGDGTYVHTFTPQGVPTSRAFSVAIVC